MHKSIRRYAPMVTPAHGLAHHNVYGGTCTPGACHDCGDVFDFFMVHDELWAAALAHAQPAPSDMRRCVNDLETWLGRALTRSEQLSVRQRFGVVFCLACFVRRIGRDLRIPEDLKTYNDGRPLPINRPLIYAAGLKR